MAVTLGKSLYLTIPIETAQGILYAHSAPVAREVFERYFLVIGKTWAEIFNQRLGMASGPRLAAMLLRDIARQEGTLDGPTGVQQGLLREIERLTNILIPSQSGGWETIPFEEAVRRNAVTAEDASEVINAAVFFTVASSMLRGSVKELYIAEAAGLWGGQTSYLNATEYGASLKTLTETATTSETPVVTEKASLPPS